MKKILMILIIPIIIYSQEFQITSNGSRRFAVDTFAKDIYWQELNTGIIYKTNIGTMETETTIFPSFPIFANKSHKAAYVIDEKLFIYDFDSDETKLLLDSNINFSIFFSFSPNDQFIMVHNIFFDLNENIKYTSPYNNIWMKPSWSSDTTLFFGDNYYIENYNFISDTRDTTFLFTDSLLLYSFDYSIKNKILAYSVDDVYAEPSNTLLRFFYIEEEKDSLIFDHWTGITQGACSHSYMAFTELKWSRDEKKISFYSDPIINSGSGVLVHFLDSNFTELYTDCDQYGVKTATEWLGNDTIIYADLTRNQIYGFDIISPLTGIENHYKDMPNTVQLGNYPNPFNPVTTIKYTIPVSSLVTLKVFDTLGREVAILINERKSIGNYSVKFNAANLPSGVYFYRLQTGDFVSVKKMLLLR